MKDVDTLTEQPPFPREALDSIQYERTTSCLRRKHPKCLKGHFAGPQEHINYIYSYVWNQEYKAELVLVS